MSSPWLLLKAFAPELAGHMRKSTQTLLLYAVVFFFFFTLFLFTSTPCPLPIYPKLSLSTVYLSDAPYPLLVSVCLCSRLCRLLSPSASLSLPGDGIMKNAPIDRAPQLRLAEMGHDRPRSILIPSYNVSTNESISAKFSIFQKPTRETGISSFVKILLSISSAI